VLTDSDADVAPQFILPIFLLHSTFIII